jgi:hypothetical protein
VSADNKTQRDTRQAIVALWDAANCRENFDIAALEKLALVNAEKVDIAIKNSYSAEKLIKTALNRIRRIAEDGPE